MSTFRGVADQDSAWPIAGTRLRLTMKKFVNRPEDAVEEALTGYVAANPGLNLHKVVVRTDIESVVRKGKVTMHQQDCPKFTLALVMRHRSRLFLFTLNVMIESVGISGQVEYV